MIVIFSSPSSVVLLELIQIVFGIVTHINMHKENELPSDPTEERREGERQRKMIPDLEVTKLLSSTKNVWYEL